MSKQLDKEQVIQHKKASIKKINNLMEYYINSTNKKHLKKVELLSYWFENFCDYIKDEETYNPKKQIRYNRGDIIKVNFGFNVGKEYGGLHYAIVIDKNNNHSSHTLTVVPLTSGTQQDTYPTDVYLGTELYNRLYARNNSMLATAENEFLEYNNLINEREACIDIITNIIAKDVAIAMTKEDNDTTDNELSNILIQQSEKYRNYCKMLDEKFEQIKKDVALLQKNQNEIAKLKTGSIALISQITSIDKARIYTPRKSTDVLYGIQFSEEKMKLINDALKNKFIF